MPTISGGDLTTIRQYPQTLNRFLSVFPRVTVFQAQVNGTPVRDTQTGGLYQFSYDNVVSGVYTDIAVGQSIDIGTTPGGRDIGTTRVRKTPTSNILYIAETAEAKLDIEDNYYVTVKNEFRPWAKLPRLVGVKNSAGYTNSFTEYHDYDEVYSNQNAQIRPKAIITESASSRRAPRPSGWLDDGQIYRTVTLSSNFSYAMATGASISSRLWNVGDGTIVVGSSSSTNITVTFPEGARYISLTVTDSNSRTQTMYWPIFAHSPNYLPLEVGIGFRITADNRDEGREMGFEIFGADGSIDETTFPEGTLLCYWEDDILFGDDAAPAQYIDQFIGWTLSDSETIKLYDSSVYRFTVGGIQSWLSRFTGYAQKVSDKTPINRWFKMANITVDRIAHYILREYSTALSICNLYLSGITTTCKAEEIKKADIWSQVSDLEKGNDYCSTIADTFGSIWIRRHYSYMELDERVAVDIVINIDKQDWTDSAGLELSSEKTDKISVVTGAGSFVSAAKNKLIYSKAPGLVPAQTGNNEDAPFLRLTHNATLNAQTRLNRFTGHHYARLNHPQNEVSLTLIGNLDIIEPAWGEPITVTWMDATLTDTVLNVEEYLVTKISVSHSNEVGIAPKTITWTLERATIGKPGVTYVPPKSGSAFSLPQIVFPKIDFPTFQPFDWFNLPPSVPTMAVIPGPSLISGSTFYNALFISDNNFSNTAIPTYTEHNLYVGTGSTRRIIAYIIDYRSPYYMGTGSTVNGWIVTSHNVIRHTDLFGARTGSIQLTFPDVVTESDVQTCLHRSSRTVPGWLMFTVTTATEAQVWTTIDGGITWENNLALSFGSIADAFFDFIHLSERVPGLAYVGRNLELYKTTDYGATWDLIHSGALPAFSGIATQGRWLHCPLHDNPQDKTLWFSNDTNRVFVKGNILPADETNWLWKVRDVNNITTDTIIELPWPSPTGYAFSSIVQNESNPGRIVTVMPNEEVVGEIYTTTDAGAKWQRKSGITPIVNTLRSTAKNPDFFYGFGIYFNFDDIFDPNNQKSLVFLSRDFGKSSEEKFSAVFDSLNSIGNKVVYVANIVGL